MNGTPQPKTTRPANDEMTEIPTPRAWVLKEYQVACIHTWTPTPTPLLNEYKDWCPKCGVWKEILANAVRPNMRQAQD